MKYLIALVCLSITERAHADWVELGVAAQCALDGTTFKILPVVSTNMRGRNVNAPSESYVFPSGIDQMYRCKLGRSDIELRLSNSPPHERGMGQGAGTVVISSLTIDGDTIISSPTNFNWHVSPGESVLNKVVITNQRFGIMFSLCYSQGWDWERPYADERCKKAWLRIAD